MIAKTTSPSDLYIGALSQVLEERRRELGLSQDELAERAGLHRTYVSLIERRAANFSIKIYVQLAYALELTPAELMLTAEVRINNRQKIQQQHAGENPEPLVIA